QRNNVLPTCACPIIQPARRERRTQQAQLIVPYLQRLAAPAHLLERLRSAVLAHPLSRCVRWTGPVVRLSDGWAHRCFAFGALRRVLLWHGGLSQLPNTSHSLTTAYGARK